MTYTIQQFAAEVKKKQPKFKGVPDAQLVQQVLTQYPEYRSWITGGTLGTDAPAQYLDPGTGLPADGSPLKQNTGESSAFTSGTAGNFGESNAFRESNAFGDAQPKRNILQKVGGFLGQATGISGLWNASKKAGEISQASDQLGVSIQDEVSRLIAEAKRYPIGNPKRKALLQQAQQAAQAGGAGADALLQAVPKDRQVLGSAGKMALTAASFGLGSAPTVAGRLAASTGLGGAFGAADAAERGASAKGIGIGAGVGAVTGLAAGGLMEGVRWAVSNLPKRITQSLSGLTNKQMGDPKAEIAISEHIGRMNYSRAAEISKTNGIIDSLGKEIQGGLERAGNPPVDLTVAFDNIARANPNSGLDAVGVRDIVAKQLPGYAKILTDPNITEVPAKLADEIRSAIGAKMGERGFRAMGDNWLQTVLGGTYGGLREGVDQAAVQAGVSNIGPLMSQQGAEITWRNGLMAAAEKAGNNKILGLGDIIAGGAGLATLGGPGAVAGVVGMKLLNSYPAGSAAAALVQNLGPILVKLAPAEQQLIVQAVLNTYGKPTAR